MVGVEDSHSEHVITCQVHAHHREEKEMLLALEPVSYPAWLTTREADASGAQHDKNK